jgi:hypothetical protein
MLNLPYNGQKDTIMKKSFILSAFASTCLILPLSSLAQSTNAMDVATTTNDRPTAKITGMNAPFDFGRINPARPYDIRINKNLCVYSSTGSYTVTVTNTDNPARFETSKPGSKPIAYQVFWNNAPNSSGGFELRSGQQSRILAGAAGECPASGENANLEVIIRGGAIKGAKAGNYKPQIDITVIPAMGP